MGTSWIGNLGVLTLLSRAKKGLRVMEIAERTGLSPWTVRNHLARLRRWGQVASRSAGEAVRVKHPRGWTSDLPLPTLVWTITPRGAARLKYLRAREG